METVELAEIGKFPQFNRKNDKQLYWLIESQGPITRDKMCHITGWPRSTVFDILVRLQIRGLIDPVTEKRTIRGRPKVYYEVTP